MLVHQSSSRPWRNGKWEVALWERREGECFSVGGASFRGRLPAQLEGELTCEAAGIRWRLQPDGDRLVWMCHGRAVGHLQVTFPGWFKKTVLRIDSNAGPFSFEVPLSLMTDERKENIRVDVTAPGGWFEICLFPADYRERRKGSDGEDEAGGLDRLVLWMLRSDSQKETDRQKEQKRLSEGKQDPLGEVKQAKSLHAARHQPPSTAIGFFTGLGTVDPPQDPVEQWLLVAAAMACYCLHYPSRAD